MAKHAPFGTPDTPERMVKADLGIKRVCPQCGSRFYDLQKRPIECPKCQYAFEPESLYKQRRPRQPEAAAAVPVAAEAEDEDSDDEDEEAEVEAEEEGIEKVATEAPLKVGTDGDEEEEEEEAEESLEDAGMTVVDAEGEVEDVEIEDEPDEEDNTLLEEVEDDDDVSDIIDTDIEKDDR